MKPRAQFLSCFISFFLMFALFQAPPALASDHGGGASGPTPLKFIVNLGDPSNGGKYLQVEMVFETASPEAEHGLAAYRPKVQHALILLLSSESPAKLLTLKGKKELMDNIIETVNHTLHESEKTGVKEVFFTSFIIQ